MNEEEGLTMTKASVRTAERMGHGRTEKASVYLHKPLQATSFGLKRPLCLEINTPAEPGGAPSLS